MAQLIQCPACEHNFAARESGNRCLRCGVRLYLIGEQPDVFGWVWDGDDWIQAPPRRCEDCGEMGSNAAPCSCWVSVKDMPLADAKALFAADGTFNVGIHGELTVSHD